MADAVTWVPVLRERAERAEAERDACHEELGRIDAALGTIDGHSAVDHIKALMAERDALKVECDRLTRGEWSKEIARQSAIAAELRAERDALKALLVEAHEWLASDRMTTWPYMEGAGGFYADRAKWLARIDAALNPSTPPAPRPPPAD